MNKTPSHPALRPSGFQPLLGHEAKRDRLLVSDLLARWDAAGFCQVSPIQVDDARTLLGGQSAEVANRAFQFMDPETGKMLALLPDVTLGIARLAAGELAESPRPLCLSYEGQAIRVSSSPARPARQLGQVGVEVIGVDETWPKRLIALALTSLVDLGLRDLHLCLVLPPFAKTLTHALSLSPDLAQALDRKDEATIRALGGNEADRLIRIMRGDLESDLELMQLRDLRDGLKSDFPHIGIRCEPFEQRGFAFQTGPSFSIFSSHHQGELGRGGLYESQGESCFGFTLFRDALLSAAPI